MHDRSYWLNNERNMLRWIESSKKRTLNIAQYTLNIIFPILRECHIMVCSLTEYVSSFMHIKEMNLNILGRSNIRAIQI